MCALFPTVVSYPVHIFSLLFNSFMKASGTNISLLKIISLFK